MQQGDLQQAASLLAEADQQQTQDPEEQALLLNTCCQLQLRLHKPDIAAQLGRQRPDSPPMRSAGPTWRSRSVMTTSPPPPNAASAWPWDFNAMRTQDCCCGPAPAAQQPAANGISLLQNLAVQQLRRDPGSWHTGNCWKPAWACCQGMACQHRFPWPSSVATSLARRNRGQPACVG